MKKLFPSFLALVLLLVSTNSFAQNIGFKAGLNLSNMFLDDGEETYTFDMNPGFLLGPTAEFSLAKHLSFETGLFLSAKGFKESESDSYNGTSYEYNRKMVLYYIDVPLTLKPTIDLGMAKLFGNIGPYVGAGLSGKMKSEWIQGDDVEKEEEDIEFGSDEDDDLLKRLDYGILIGAGVELNSIHMGLSYGHGLANISAYTEEGNRIHHRVIRITGGYKF